MSRRNLVICILTGTFGLMGYSQKNPEIKRVPPSNTDPTSGVEMYRTYCAVCHGLDGKGNGPAARALKQQPSDLTLLSKRNGGAFPTFRISNIIQGDAISRLRIVVLANNEVVMKEMEQRSAGGTHARAGLEHRWRVSSSECLLT